MKKYFIGLLILCSIMVIGFLLTGIHFSGAEEKYIAVNGYIDILSFHEYDGKLYIGTTDGLYILIKRQDTYDMEKVSLDYPITFIRAMHTDQFGRLWLGGIDGMVVMDGEEQLFFERKSGGLPHNTVYCFYEDINHHIWVGTESGIVIYDQELQEVRRIFKADGLYNDMVKTIVPDAFGGLFIASYNVRDGGISYLKDNQWLYFDASTVVNVNTTQLMFLRDDLLWVGSGLFDEGGITEFTYSNSAWLVSNIWSLEDGLAGAKVRSMYQFEDRIYVASEYDGIAVKSEDTDFVVYTVENGLTHNEVKCFTVYDGRLFLGTKTGLCYEKGN